MKLSTGKVKFDIEFDNGDKGAIYFNPSDMDLPVRLKDFQGKVSERLKKFEEIETDNNGENADFVEELRKAKQVICEELDTAFGGEISAVVFKHCSPLAIVNGEYFIVQFINAVRPELEKQIKKANESLENAMAKHGVNYQHKLK